MRSLCPALWALLSLAACGEPVAPVPHSFPNANLLIISLDTLRADDVGAYGGVAGISPTLDRIAAEGIVFEQARSVAPHTAPSHMSLFTSRLPSEHGVHNVAAAVEGAEGTVVQVGADRYLVNPLPAEIPTLAEVLKFRGFATTAFTDGGNVSQVHGFARGFEHYTAQLDGASDDARDAIDWLKAHGYIGGASPGAEPPPRFFMFWHTYQIHSPYAPPPDYIERYAPDDYSGPLRGRVLDFGRRGFEGLKKGSDDEFWEGKQDFSDEDARFLHGVYRGGVRLTDDILAGLFDHLRRAGILDNTIVVLLADHGEEFREHEGFGHMQVYEEHLSVPLIVRLPGGVGGGRRIKTRVSLLDVMPTVLELLDVGGEVIDRLDPAGHSLADVLTGGGEPPRRALTAEVQILRPDQRMWEWRGAHWVDDTKFLWLDERPVGDPVWQPGKRELFDLAEDPDELDDLAPKGDPRLSRMLDLHDEWSAKVRERAGKLPAGAAELTPEMLEQLRQLGYVGDKQ